MRGGARPNSGVVGINWTADHIAFLTAEWAKGTSTVKIPELMNEAFPGIGWTKNMIIGKSHRLSLPSRPSPIKNRAAYPHLIAAPKITLPLIVASKPVITDAVRARAVVLLTEGRSSEQVAAITGMSRHAVSRVKAKAKLPMERKKARMPGYFHSHADSLDRETEAEPMPLVAMMKAAAIEAAATGRIVVTEPRVASKRGCHYPMWGDNERPKFRNGLPWLCDAGIVSGAYCPEHAAICFVPRRVRVLEAAE